MKNLLPLIFLLTLTFGCKKKEETPFTAPPIKTVGLFIYRIEEIQASDTAQMIINNAQVEPRYNYHVALKPGDVLSFYYSSKSPNMNFAIWQDYNGPYDVIYFKSKERVAGSNYYVKGTYTVPALH